MPSAHGPFAQRTNLGWTVVGDVCLNGAHLHEKISVSRTLILPSGRPSLMEPCDKNILVKPDLSIDPIFDRTVGDEKCSLSIEVKVFLKLMDDGFIKNADGKWVAPLPFRNGQPKLENNRDYVRKRMLGYHLKMGWKRTQKRNPTRWNSRKESLNVSMQQLLLLYCLIMSVGIFLYLESITRRNLAKSVLSLTLLPNINRTHSFIWNPNHTDY